MYVHDFEEIQPGQSYTGDYRVDHDQGVRPSGVVYTVVGDAPDYSQDAMNPGVFTFYTTSADAFEDFDFYVQAAVGGNVVDREHVLIAVEDPYACGVSHMPPAIGIW